VQTSKLFVIEFLDRPDYPDLPRVPCGTFSNMNISKILQHCSIFTSIQKQSKGTENCNAVVYIIFLCWQDRFVCIRKMMDQFFFGRLKNQVRTYRWRKERARTRRIIPNMDWTNFLLLKQFHQFSRQHVGKCEFWT